MDLKIPISHSMQVECNGKEGQISGLRSVGFKGGEMGAGAPRSNDKSPSSDVPVSTTNVRPAAPAGLKAAVIRRSEPYDLTQMDPVGGMEEGDNRSIGYRRLESFADTKDIVAEHSGEQIQSKTMSEFFGSPKRDSEIRGAVLEGGVGIMGDNAVGVRGGSKVHVQKSVNPEVVGVSGGSKVYVQKSVKPEVVPGRAPSCAGHVPLGSTSRYFNHSDMGTEMGIKNIQPQRGMPMGGGQVQAMQIEVPSTWVQDRDLAISRAPCPGDGEGQKLGLHIPMKKTVGEIRLYPHRRLNLREHTSQGPAMDPQIRSTASIALRGLLVRVFKFRIHE